MDVFSPLNLFGAVTVTAMMLSYIAEERSRIYTLSFCATCAGASAYGWLSGTWPFGVIEAVWAVFAFRKWHNRPKQEL